MMRIPGSEYTAPFLGQTAVIDTMKGRLNDIYARLSALEIGTLQQAADGEWYACYWDEEQGRTQCERSAPPTALQAEMLALSPGERATLQQELTAEAVDLVRQIDEATRQVYYGDADPATTTVRVTSQQTAEGPIQVITTGPYSPSVAVPPDGTGSGAGNIVVSSPGDGGGGGDGDGDQVIPSDVDAVPTASTGSGGLLVLGAIAAALFLFGRKRGR